MYSRTRVLVCGVGACRRHPGDGQGFVHRDRALRDALGERRPLDEFHHQRDRAIGLFESVNRGDVRMVQRGEDFRFRFVSVAR